MLARVWRSRRAAGGTGCPDGDGAEAGALWLAGAVFLHSLRLSLDEAFVLRPQGR
jgi:hypothetical protein